MSSNTTFFFMSLLLCFLLTSFTISEQPNNVKSVRPFIQVYNNGTITRDYAIPVDAIPPQTPDPLTRVTSKDVTLNRSINLTARIYLPALQYSSQKLPILVYFHGGGFCIGSAFSKNDHEYLNELTSQGRVISISINYRLYPDFTLPIAFKDAWFAVQWVASQRHPSLSTEPWLAFHGDFSKLFLGGDSSGATIVHNMAMKASLVALPYGLHIYGAILVTPHFLSSVKTPLDAQDFFPTPYYRIWPYVCPNCPHGVDNPSINPVGPRSPGLRRLAVEKVLVYTAELDPLLGRALAYVTGIRSSKWEGVLAYYRGKNVSHVFHVSGSKNLETKLLIVRLSNFLRT